MDAGNCCFGAKVAEEPEVPESALDANAPPAHLQYAMRCEQASDGADARAHGAPAVNEDDEDGKFGVEEHALYDFRDYGLD